MNHPLLSIAALAALSLSACGKPDEAALAKGDAAFQGQTVDGQLQPVASRPVRLGTAGPDSNGCGRIAAPASGALSVRWSASADGPVKAEVTGNVAVCETDGAWSGIIFPAFGQELDECYATARVPSPREYQGPCRSGWVQSNALAASAS